MQSRRIKYTRSRKSIYPFLDHIESFHSRSIVLLVLQLHCLPNTQLNQSAVVTALQGKKVSRVAEGKVLSVPGSKRRSQLWSHRRKWGAESRKTETICFNRRRIQERRISYRSQHPRRFLPSSTAAKEAWIDVQLFGDWWVDFDIVVWGVGFGILYLELWMGIWIERSSQTPILNLT